MEKEKINKKDTEITLTDLKHRIFIIRGQKVMLDFHLAELYQVQTKVLMQAVRRNQSRFPDDFCFQLTDIEFVDLRSQIVTANSNHSKKRYLPYAFTEHGVAMLSSVLRSPRAVQVNIFIIRAFIKMREILLENKDLALKIDQLEHTQEKQGERLDQISNVVVQLISAMSEPDESTEPVEPKPQIGFNLE